jgi:2-oxo-hept-3-ene-1,7-dioate hydratase
MDRSDVDLLAAELAAAPRIQDVPPLTARHPGMTLDDGYAVQRRYAELRAASGDALAGWKVAMVSPKRQQEVGVTEPVIGRMFESGRVADGGDIRDVAGDGAIVECELAFVLSADLMGPDVSVEHVLAATSAIVPAFEIVERRSPAGATFPDRIAVNHAAGFVLGTNALHPADVHRTDTELRFEVDGQVVSTGPVGGALGDPALVVAWLANRLALLGEHLRAGEVILTGRIVPDVAVREARSLRAVCSGSLGSVAAVGLR